MPNRQPKILFLAANPYDTKPVSFEREIRDIKDALDRAKKKYITEQYVAVRPIDIRRALLNQQPQFVHFCGYGGGNKGIAFEDKLGQAQLVSTEALTGLFRLFSNNVQCVVLNACYSEFQAKAIAGHINYVIGMNEQISNQAAIEFAVAFYDAIGAGKSIEFAFELGRNAIQMAGLSGYKTPVLVKRKTKEESSEDVEIFQKLEYEDDVGHRPDNGRLSNEALVDWGDAPDVPVFFGRAMELETLKKWILHDRCRLVLISGIRGVGKTNLSIRLGKGGIGKTDLSLQFAKDIQKDFEFIIWRKLLNAPTVNDILEDIIKFLSNQQESKLPENDEKLISLLVYYLKKSRCLIILDNVETILSPSKSSGGYEPGYEGYGNLFQKIGEIPHKSCMLLTSREKPQEIIQMEGRNRPVRVLALGGLDVSDGYKIFNEIGTFDGKDEDWKRIVDYYDGNPLALELAARHIREVFFGDIAAFLRVQKLVIHDLSELLKWHIDRLSDSEKEILYWLTIEREPSSILELKDNLLSSSSKDNLTSNLQLLQRQLPLEKSEKKYTLQPVLIEYMTERLVESISKEICEGEIELYNTLALVKALAKSYVRESQIRLIVKKVVNRLTSVLGNLAKVERQLLTLIEELRNNSPGKAGYAAGNTLNLLGQLKRDLSNYNFSHLTIWQGYFQGINLRNTDFSYSEIAKSIFTQIFGNILAISFSPDGQLLAAGGTTNTIRLWRFDDSQPVLTLSGHTGWVRTLTFSPNGKIIASGGEDNTLRLWGVDDGRTLHVLKGHTYWINSINFAPDSEILATGSEDRTIKLWNVRTGECIKTLKGHTDRVRSVVFSPDGKTIASASSDGKIILWDARSGSPLKTFIGHTDWVLSVRFTPDGQKIVSGSFDNTIKIWRVSDIKCLHTLHGHSDWVWSIAINPKGETISSGGRDCTIRLWEILNANCISVLHGHSSTVRSVCFRPDGISLASGGEDQTVRIWDIRDGKCLNILQGYTNVVWSVACSPDGKILVSGSDDGVVRVWETETGKCLRELHGHKERIWSVAISPDGNIIASGSSDLTIRLWSPKTGKNLKILQGHADWVLEVAFSPDGKTIASGGANKDKRLKIWDIYTGECLRVFQERAKAIFYNSDGKELVIGSYDGVVRQWNIESGKCFNTLRVNKRGLKAVSLSPNGQMVATESNDNTVKIWELSTRKCVLDLKGHQDKVYAVVYCPRGPIIASGGEDKTVKLWTLNSGKCLRTLKGHESRIRSVVFSPDGAKIFTGSDDGTLKSWDTVTGKCLGTFRVIRPYEGLNITGVTGLTNAQKSTLEMLGAIDNEE